MAFKYLLFATTSNSIEEDKHKTHSVDLFSSRLCHYYCNEITIPQKDCYNNNNNIIGFKQFKAELDEQEE